MGAVCVCHVCSVCMYNRVCMVLVLYCGGDRACMAVCSHAGMCVLYIHVYMDIYGYLCIYDYINAYKCVYGYVHECI